MSLPSRVLRQGSSGADVTILQTLLNKHLPTPLGYALSVDGDFGPATWNAVVAFQGQCFLKRDGVVGKKTWGAFGEAEGLMPPASIARPGGPGAPPPASPSTPPANATPPSNATPPAGGANGGQQPAAGSGATGPVRGTMRFRRTGVVGDNGGFVGELSINGKTWGTVERGGGYTSVRAGTYTLTMDMKGGTNPRPGIRFDEHAAIRAVLWHDAYNDSCLYLEGCIAPGSAKDDGMGISGSKQAMAEVFLALGGYTQGAKVTCVVENNAPGKGGSKDEWIRTRAAQKGLRYP